MSSTTGRRALRQEPWPAVTGRPGLTQGRYGSVGNLELVAAAADGGLWVGWFNADPTESWSGAAIGRWSGALRFGARRRFLEARIAQVDAGPDWLEAVGRTADGNLRRHVWSPADGFVDHGVLAADVASTSAVVTHPGDGSLLLAVAHHDGMVRVLRGEAGPSYPDLLLVEQPAPDCGPAVAVDAAWHVDHLDLLAVEPAGVASLLCGERRDLVATGVVTAALAIGPADHRWVATVAVSGTCGVRDMDAAPEHPVELGPAESVTVAAVVVAGRPECHVVTRRGAGLTHHRLTQPIGATQPVSAAVAAAVWIDTGTDSVRLPDTDD